MISKLMIALLAASAQPATPGAESDPAAATAPGATVAWQVDGSGRITSCTVVKTSGNPKTDRKACDAVLRLRPKASGQATISPTEKK